jgi:hypothetical protein
MHTSSPRRESWIVRYRQDGLATLSDMNLTKSYNGSGTLQPATRDYREPEAIARARHALRVVRSDVFGWPSDRGNCRQISDCAELLKDDLETHDGLLDGRVYPMIEFPELDQGWSGDALEQAVEKVTRDIAAGASALGSWCFVSGAEAIR